MRILLTNDDGIHSPGLLALKHSLSAIAEVVAVAPQGPRSAVGHAITLHKPLRISPVRLQDGSSGYASNGTPSDCVLLGISDAVGPRPDLVVSGINVGPNLGHDVTYSGTVSAAMEAAIFGLPGIAVSVASYETQDFGLAAKVAADLAQQVYERGLPDGTFLNVNVPADLPADAQPPIVVTRQGTRRYEGRLEKRIDPRGIAYYWLTGNLLDHDAPADTDVAAVLAGQVSVTPIQLDLTNHAFLDELRTWNL